MLEIERILIIKKGTYTSHKEFIFRFPSARLLRVQRNHWQIKSKGYSFI